MKSITLWDKVYGQSPQNMKDIINESIRYWEIRRAAYNGILGLVVAGSFFHCHQTLSLANWPSLIGLLLAAVVANVLYCAAYAADLFLQLSGHRDRWLRCRWMLWLLGTAFAAGIYLIHE